jgi:hypothetical protein
MLALIYPCICTDIPWDVKSVQNLESAFTIVSFQIPMAGIQNQHRS